MDYDSLNYTSVEVQLKFSLNTSLAFCSDYGYFEMTNNVIIVFPYKLKQPENYFFCSQRRDILG